MIYLRLFVQYRHVSTSIISLSVVNASKKIKMADENNIDNGGSPGHTNKKTRLTVEERKQVVASLLIGSTWHNETPKLASRSVVRVAKKFTKHVSTIRHA
jgi:hypothetical protein